MRLTKEEDKAGSRNMPPPQVHELEMKTELKSNENGFWGWSFEGVFLDPTCNNGIVSERERESEREELVIGAARKTLI
uniref:Uncharacterized protein n=1 Tax=Rhizophora mucronata TaxID=61149 RepID=A0A2P2P1V4_RHIMU